MKRKFLYLCLLSFLLILQSCKNTEEKQKAEKTVENNFSTLSEEEKKDFNTSAWIKVSTSGDTKSFASACVSAAIVDDLMNVKDITVFAPNNKAFDAASTQQKSVLHEISKKEALQKMLRSYIVPQKLSSVDIVQALNDTDQLAYENLAGTKIFIVKNNMELYLLNEKGDSSKIVLSDIKASNGVVHVMEKML